MFVRIHHSLSCFFVSIQVKLGSGASRDKVLRAFAFGAVCVRSTERVIWIHLDALVLNLRLIPRGWRNLATNCRPKGSWVLTCNLSDWCIWSKEVRITATLVDDGVIFWLDQWSIAISYRVPRAIGGHVCTTLAFEANMVFYKRIVVFSRISTATCLLARILAPFQHVRLINITGDIDVLVAHDLREVMCIPICVWFKCCRFAHFLIFLGITMVLGSLKHNAAVYILIWISFTIALQLVWL